MSEKAENKLADDLLRIGEKRGADEILGMDIEGMSPTKIRKLLREKGIVFKAKGGSLGKAIDRVKKEQEFRNGGVVDLGDFKGQF